MRKVDSFGMIDCQLVKHDEAQKVLKECITSVKADLTSKADPVISYVAGLCSYLCGEQIWDSETWRRCCTVHFESVCSSEAQALGTAYRQACMDRWKEKVVDTWGADLDPDLKTACDVEFSLAYGGKLLLHNTRLFLKCGRRYGICGKNGVGKTTLMRNVDNGKIEGLDPDLCSVFVESHADEDPDVSASVLKTFNLTRSRRWRRVDGVVTITHVSFPRRTRSPSSSGSAPARGSSSDRSPTKQMP